MMFFLFLLPTAVYSHGRLTVPKTRLQDKLGYDTYENDPIGFGGRPLSQFVCRNDPVPSASRTRVTAGQSMDMRWINSARHVGDCAVYVGYGDAIVNGMGDAKNSGQFVKIANIYDCKRYSEQTIQIELPSWLPAGPAVIRWEWYALHVSPTIEFYAQCADVEISSASTLSAADLPSYSVYPWVIPERADEGVGYRNAFDLATPQYITGPPCAFPGDAPASAKCEATAPGTLGHIAVGLGPDKSGEVAAPAPTPEPTKSPVASPVALPTQEPTDVAPPTQEPTATPLAAPVEAPTSPPVESPVTAPTSPPVESPVTAPTSPPVESPVAAPTSPPVDDGSCSNQLWAKCDGLDWDGSPFSGEKCCPAGAYCNWQTQWYSQCIPVESCTKSPYDQCAGAGFYDSPCCPEGHYCKDMNVGISLCAPLQ